jgi:hypothetical protein
LVGEVFRIWIGRGWRKELVLIKPFKLPEVIRYRGVVVGDGWLLFIEEFLRRGTGKDGVVETS